MLGSAATALVLGTLLLLSARPKPQRAPLRLLRGQPRGDMTEQQHVTFVRRFASSLLVVGVVLLVIDLTS